MFSRIFFVLEDNMFKVCHINDIPKADHEGQGLSALDLYVLEFFECWDAPGDESMKTTDGQALHFFRACCEQIVVRCRKLSKDDRKKLDACAAIILVGDNVLYFD